MRYNGQAHIMINPIMQVDVYIINGAMSFFVACGCSRTIHSPARSSLTGQDNDMCRDITAGSTRSLARHAGAVQCPLVVAWMSRHDELVSCDSMSRTINMQHLAAVVGTCRWDIQIAVLAC